MPKFKITISDTVTYARTATVIVEAPDEEAAEEIGAWMTVHCTYPQNVSRLIRKGDPIDFDEEEIDNTPWDIEVEQA